MFMREKPLTEAGRCSLENFCSMEYIDKEDADAVRHVRICPLYAKPSLGLIELLLWKFYYELQLIPHHRFPFPTILC